MTSMNCWVTSSRKKHKRWPGESTACDMAVQARQPPSSAEIDTKHQEEWGNQEECAMNDS
jgi:hypothetical protein